MVSHSFTIHFIVIHSVALYFMVLYYVCLLFCNPDPYPHMRDLTEKKLERDSSRSLLEHR